MLQNKQITIFFIVLTLYISGDKRKPKMVDTQIADHIIIH